MMDGMDTDLSTYQGPAVLVSDDEDREYAVGVRIRTEYDRGVDPDTDEVRWETRSWNADVDGRFPAPPYGDCTLRLPGGREAKAVFAQFQRSGESEIWVGRLEGRGPEPSRG